VILSRICEKDARDRRCRINEIRVHDPFSRNANRTAHRLSFAKYRRPSSRDLRPAVVRWVYLGVSPPASPPSRLNCQSRVVLFSACAADERQRNRSSLLAQKKKRDGRICREELSRSGKTKLESIHDEMTTTDHY